ncbi:DUF2834 domain-containing protein [Roseibium sediminicola]|uniref:DUF2834 domain-containing protein n=1 Tax=Roseibium sediminicola TaxID=2933272 RepID=A0ABT0GQ93_9HYPH|nr:DUF2834 domain-containing protein [Roseibium sp. CAU 1639]MCK7611594.1 DUF2834 domain-containing protein [Roseibium sp. CAU 1639]
MKTVYLVAAVAGTLLPWAFFAGFLGAHGADIPLFVSLLFASKPSAGITTDLLISCAVFWIWSWRDARENGVAGWWLTIPAIWFVGLSLGLPLYLWLREKAREGGM